MYRIQITFLSELVMYSKQIPDSLSIIEHHKQLLAQFGTSVKYQCQRAEIRQTVVDPDVIGIVWINCKITKDGI